MMLYSLAAFLLFSGFLSVSDSATFSWKEKSMVVNEGEDVSITCKTEDLDFFDVVRLSICTKRPPDCSKYTTISENIQLKEYYKNTSRYELKFDGEETTLKINNVVNADAGTIQCLILGHDEPDIMTLVVKSRAKSIKFFTTDEKGVETFYRGTEVGGLTDVEKDGAKPPTLPVSIMKTRSYGCAIEIFDGSVIKESTLKIGGKKEECESKMNQNLKSLLLTKKKVSLDNNDKVMECSVKVGDFELQTSKILLNITIPGRILDKENGYLFFLRNHSQRANETTASGVVYELIFHVYGNPIPTVKLQHPYKKEPLILTEPESTQLAKVTISYSDYVDVQAKQSIVVENGEGFHEFEFSLGDSKAVKLIDSDNDDFKIEEKGIEILKETIELTASLRNFQSSSGGTTERFIAFSTIVSLTLTFFL